MKCALLLAVSLTLCHASPAAQDMGMGMGMGVRQRQFSMMMQRMKREHPVPDLTKEPMEEVDASLPVQDHSITTRNTMSMMSKFQPAKMGMKREALNLTTTTTTTTELPLKEHLPLNTTESPKPILPDKPPGLPLTEAKIIQRREVIPVPAKAPLPIETSKSGDLTKPLPLNDTTELKKDETKVIQKPTRELTETVKVAKNTPATSENVSLTKPKRATPDIPIPMGEVKLDKPALTPEVKPALLNQTIKDAPLGLPKKEEKVVLKPELHDTKVEVVKEEKVSGSSLPADKMGRRRRSSYGSTRASYAVREAPAVRVREYSTAPPPAVRVSEYSTAPPPVVRTTEYTAPTKIETPVRAAYGSRVQEMREVRSEYAAAPAVRSSYEVVREMTPVRSSYEAVREAPVRSSYEAVREVPVRSSYDAVREAPVRSSYEAVREVPVRSSYDAVREAPVRSSYEAVREVPVVRSAYAESTAAPIRISMETYQPPAVVREAPRYRRSTNDKVVDAPKSTRKVVKGLMKRKIGPGMMVKVE